MSQLTEKDLSPRATQVLTQIIRERERPKASRDDIAAGFIGALIWLHSKSSFRAEAETIVDEEWVRLR